MDNDIDQLVPWVLMVGEYDRESAAQVLALIRSLDAETCGAMVRFAVGEARWAIEHASRS